MDNKDKEFIVKKRDFIVRRAAVDDLDFIRELAVKNAEFVVPQTRDIPLEEVKRETRKHYKTSGKELITAENVVILIAEKLTSRERLGYLVLVLNEEEKSTGEKQSVIYDLAVRKEYWGKCVTHALMKRAAEITKEHGLKYIIGEISVHNKRAFITATKALGYTLERYQIVRKLF